jgi:hypothetical protein
MLAWFALLAASQAAPTPPQHYHLVVKTSGEQDLTSQGHGKVSGTLDADAHITVTSADSADGIVVKVTLDSVALTPTGAVAEQLQQHPTAAHDARGISVRVFVSHGKISGPMQLSDSTNPVMSVITQAIGVLYPGLRRGVKVGDKWADTTRINNSGGPGGSRTGQVIATWKVTAAAGDALVLDGTSESHTRADDGNGQVLTLTGTSQEHMVVPPSGPVRRATIETTNDLSMTAPQLSTPIPGKTSGSLELTPAP